MFDSEITLQMYWMIEVKLGGYSSSGFAGNIEGLDIVSWTKVIKDCMYWGAEQWIFLCLMLELLSWYSCHRYSCDNPMDIIGHDSAVQQWDNDE